MPPPHTPVIPPPFVHNLHAPPASPSVIRLSLIHLYSPHPLPAFCLQFCPLLDQRVEVTGTSRQDLNGQRGVATDFHPVRNTDGLVVGSQSRYTVLFDSGQAYKLKRDNVCAERANVSQARPKAKGEGKKGRRSGA